MGIFSNIFGPNFPSYKDHILYNGQILYKPTGNFNGTFMEMEPARNTGRKIWFNLNHDKQTYFDSYSNYDLYRYKDSLSGFIPGHHGGVMGAVSYVPTGRSFRREDGKGLWEGMAIDDPSDVIFMGLPDPLIQDAVFGSECLDY